MSERKLVLLYNHADADESFVSMLTEEEIKRMKDNETDFDEALMQIAEENKVDLADEICYYA